MTRRTYIFEYLRVFMVAVSVACSLACDLASEEAVRDQGQSAEAAYISCYAGQPEMPELLKRLYQLIAQYPHSDIVDDAWLDIGRLYVATGDYSRAEIILRRLITDFPEAVRVDKSGMFVGGMTERDFQVYRIAQEHYQKFPDRTAEYALLTLANLYDKKGDILKAISTLEQILEATPGDAHSEKDRNLIDTLIAQEIIKREDIFPRETDAGFRVASLMQKLLLRQRPHCQALIGLVEMNAKAGKFADAIETYEKLIRSYGHLLEGSKKQYLESLLGKKKNQKRNKDDSDHEDENRGQTGPRHCEPTLTPVPERREANPPGAGPSGVPHLQSTATTCPEPQRRKVSEEGTELFAVIGAVLAILAIAGAGVTFWLTVVRRRPRP